MRGVKKARMPHAAPKSKSAGIHGVREGPVEDGQESLPDAEKLRFIGDPGG